MNRTLPPGKPNGSKWGAAVIDALIAGRLRGVPQLKTAANGSPFASFRVAATDRNGTSLLCSCITFSATACAAVQALDDGDSVAVSGEASVKTWAGSDGAQRHGLDVLVHGVLTSYHLGRKRKASEGKDAGSEPDGGPL